jgi:hypothetical protein
VSACFVYLFILFYFLWVLAEIFRRKIRKIIFFGLFQSSELVGIIIYFLPMSFNVTRVQIINNKIWPQLAIEQISQLDFFSKSFCDYQLLKPKVVIIWQLKFIHFLKSGEFRSLPLARSNHKTNP